jgi:hypothetical protein
MIGVAKSFPLGPPQCNLQPAIRELVRQRWPRFGDNVKYARLYTAPDGESHFELIETKFAEVNYVESASPLELSETTATEQLCLMKAPAGWESDWHPSASRNLFVVLSGEWEVMASDGDTRRFRTGDLLLVEDVSGKGHRSRVVIDAESVAVIVVLASK